MSSSSSPSTGSLSSSDGSVRPAFRPIARLRPLCFHTEWWALRSLRPAGDFVCAVLFPSIFGILGSYREGSRFLLFLDLRAIARLLAVGRDIRNCLLSHLMLTPAESPEIVTVVKRFRKRSAPPEDLALDTAPADDTLAVLASDTESLQALSVPSSASPFQVASAKAGSARRFDAPSPLPSCFKPLSPRFRSPFQVGCFRAVASETASQSSAIASARFGPSEPFPKPLPAFLPMQPSLPELPTAKPLPIPVPKPASFYASYPTSALASSGRTICSEVKPSGPSLLKPPPESVEISVCDLQPSAPNTKVGFVSSRQVHQERSAAVVNLFLQLCAILQPLSRVLAGLQGSLNKLEFQSRLLRKVSDTTAVRYLRSALLFIQTVEDLGGTVLALTDALAADAIFVLRRAGEGCLGHPSNVLKAVRWVSKTLEPVPWPNLWSSLFGIFSGSGAVERKESVPLPCSFLVGALNSRRRLS